MILGAISGVVPQVDWKTLPRRWMQPGSVLFTIELTHNHYDHKGKVEHTKISIDIPFACYHPFSMQPARQGWFANPDRRPGPGRHDRCDDHADPPHADKNNCQRPFIHHDAGSCLTSRHAHPTQYTRLVNV